MFDRLFIHTPLHLFDEAIDHLAELGLAPEIYFSALHLDQLSANNKPLERVKAKLDEHSLPCSFHGPFLDLSPAAYDSKITAATKSRFLDLFAIAEKLQPEVIILHSGYERWRFNQNINLWLEQSLSFWRPLVKHVENIGSAIAVENIFETTPGGLRMLYDEIASPAFGGCFDIGHWNLFAKMDLSEWLGLLQDHILAFHLHDNRGKFDDHMVPGDGFINFAALKSVIETYKIHAKVHTFELHQREELKRGVEWFKQNDFLMEL